MANDQSVGAIWVKKKGDNIFLSIKINDTNYVAFKNKYKEKENQPDYNILKAQRQEQPKQDEAQRQVEEFKKEYGTEQAPKDPVDDVNAQAQQYAEEQENL